MFPASRRCALLLAAALSPTVCLAEIPGDHAVEALGCPQLSFDYDAPELVFDDRVLLYADEVLMDQGGLSSLAGAVRLRQGDRVFSADAMSYDEASRSVTVNSESLFRNRSLVVKSREARFDLNAESGIFLGTEFTLPDRAARGDSAKVEIRGNGTVDLEQASYTTCAPGSDAWYIRASKIRLDHADGLGTARNAQLRFMDVPVLYLPWFQFPIDDRRRSGLLYPTVGSFSGAGTDIRWPVYLNLAANYDATVTPRFMADRGLQGGLNFRYLLKHAEGSANYEYLDDRRYGEQRALFRLDNRTLINRRLALEAEYAETSDKEYFEDLGGTLSSASMTHLEQTARLTYQAPAAYTITAMVQNFQPIASNLSGVDDPYKRLPQIRVRSLTRNALFHTRAGLDSEMVNFARDASVEGGRVMLAPYLRFERQAAAWYTQAQADLHHTQYDLSGIAAGSADRPSRTLPVVSAETGLRFERVTGSGRLQTLTPRGFALYVPFENQDELPLFDTGEPDFDFVQLFARNRFSGEDRVADARHVAGAVTLRELDPQSGESPWSASVGQLYRVTAPEVGLPGVPPPDRGATEFIGQFDWRVAQGWRASLAGQWSPEEENFERAQLALRYRSPATVRRLDLAYRYRRDRLEQADLAFLTPLAGNWSVAARTRYSLRDSSGRENFAGIEYGTCCWALRVSWRRFIGDSTGRFDSGVYVQLQLKGLASLGAGGETLLPASEMDGDQPP